MPQSHFHNHYEILYISEGKRKLTLNDKSSFTLDKNTIAFIKPFIAHKTEYIGTEFDRNTRILVNFSQKNSEVMRNISDCNILFPFYLKNPVITLDDKERKFAFDLLSKMSKEFSENMKRIMLLELLTYLWERKGAGEKVSYPTSSNKIEEICEYINKNFEKDISLDSLSEMFFINKHHISRTFKKHMNINFSDYLNNTRINNAKELLKKGSSITDAALFSGYSGITHFERMFKRKEGMSPKEWKRIVNNE